MFILTTFSDLVQIPPHEFYKRDRDEIEDKLNEKYANKIVQKIGLCICLFDVLKASDGIIGHGSGDLNVNVEFRMIVFRPFEGEIIPGRIIRESGKGIYVSTEFFDDIFVPDTMLFAGSRFDAGEGVWIWKTDDGEDFFYDVGDVVRLRVEGETWQDQAPKGPQNIAIENGADERTTPYSITAAMNLAGLGPAYWW